MDDVQELIARVRICEVKARYCRYLDTKDWDGFGSLFTGDAVLDVRDDTGAPPFHGRAAIVRTVRDVVQFAKTSHQVHSPEIAFDDRGGARVIWAMQDRVAWQEGKSPIAPACALTGYGHYHEHYVWQDGVWLIASLKLTRLNVETGT
jgi:hypothetical protein